jgi:hypothetical protein
MTSPYLGYVLPAGVPEDAEILGPVQAARDLVILPVNIVPRIS